MEAHGARRTALSVLAALSVFAALPLHAQQSASFKLDEGVLNAAGHPEQGGTPSSPGFEVTLDAVGDAVAGASLSSPSFRVDGGFAASYPPPGEVHGLRFDDAVTLGWDSERSVGTYNLYRGALAGLPADYGACEQFGIATSSTTDTGTPTPGGTGFFYLITARNRLREDGTKGFDSNGQERPTPAACP